MSLRERLALGEDAQQAPSAPAMADGAYQELKKSMHQMILERIDLERLKRLTPEQFKAWRTRMGWSQEHAAQRLGIGKSTVQLYERGHRAEDRRLIEIPLNIALACIALGMGLTKYDEKEIARYEKALEIGFNSLAYTERNI